jgi:hypothetical protein
MDCRLQVFKHENISKNTVTNYRFAIVDYSSSKSYPANFVCMLPTKVDLVKGKSANVFGGLFGDKSVDFAKELLNKALKIESNAEVKTEIERRLRLLDAKQARTVECSECKKTFKSTKIRKYKKHFCRECYRKRFGCDY